MSFLPIVERELRVVARKASIYRRRTGVALLSTGVAFVFLIAGWVSGSTRLGGQVFSTLVVLAFMYCLFEGLRGADSLSEENREGTLGLLFLTDLRGYDVVLGKLVAIAVRSFHGLLAFLPVLAMALILGGVTAGEFWRSALVLLNTLFFSLSIALCVSAFSRQAHRAIGGTILLLALITVGPLLLQQGPMPGLLKPLITGIAAVSPATAIHDAQDVAYRTAAGEFWASIGVTHGLSWLALATAGLVVRTSWQDRESKRLVLLGKQLWHDWRTGDADIRVAQRAGLLDVNPFLWLTVRHRRDPLLIGLLFGGIAVLGLVGWFAKAPGMVQTCSLVSLYLLLIWIGWRAALAFGEARQSGAMELLLVTPIPVEEMLHGYWLGFKSLFVVPAGFVLLLRMMAHLTPAFQNPAALPLHRGLWELLAVGYDSLSCVVSFVAMYWVGMWMGISRRRPLRAFFYAMLLGLIVPTVLVCIPNIAIHLGLLSWARTRLLREFRLMASRQGAPHSWQVIRPHLLPNANVPPVIVQR